jgi:hypothetical protein
MRTKRVLIIVLIIMVLFCNAANSQGISIMSDPGNLTSLRNNNGTTYSIKVTGTAEGSVWGGADGIYTDDSRLGKAAVHAGLLRIGQEGVIVVKILPGQPAYTASTNNGITTTSYGAYSGSFKFESGSTIKPILTTPSNFINDPGNLTSFRNNNGTTYSIKVTGTAEGSVWGGADGIYTDDSRLGKAAVHAGLLNIGQEGVVVVRILPGQPAYTASANNGITTAGYGAYSGSFKFEGGSSFKPILTTPSNFINDPGNLTSFRNNNGTTYSIKVTGTAEGSVWGGADGIYTDDSRLGKAAVHAGLLKIGQEGVIVVRILAGQSAYTASTNNGITTTGYGAYSGSFKFEGGSTFKPILTKPSNFINDPGNLISFRNNNGKTYSIKVTGTAEGSVWGGADGIYTDDSRLGKAAVHAGLLKIGQEGVVVIRILPGQPTYTASTNNGITTAGYGAYSGSFKFE